MDLTYFPHFHFGFNCHGQCLLINYNGFIYGRRRDIYFNITSPVPGTFVIALHYRGREAAILEMDLKLDDLLEKVNIPVFAVALSESYLVTHLIVYYIATRQRSITRPRIRPVRREQNTPALEQDVC